MPMETTSFSIYSTRRSGRILIKLSRHILKKKVLTHQTELFLRRDGRTDMTKKIVKKINPDTCSVFIPFEISTVKCFSVEAWRKERTYQGTADDSVYTLRLEKNLQRISAFDSSICERTCIVEE